MSIYPKQDVYLSGAECSSIRWGIQIFILFSNDSQLLQMLRLKIATDRIGENEERKKNTDELFDIKSVPSASFASDAVHFLHHACLKGEFYQIPQSPGSRNSLTSRLQSIEALNFAQIIFSHQH